MGASKSSIAMETTPPWEYHTRVSTHRNAEALPRLWVFALNKETKTNGKMPGNAAHHYGLHLVIRNDLALCYISHISSGERPPSFTVPVTDWSFPGMECGFPGVDRATGDVRSESGELCFGLGFSWA